MGYKKTLICPICNYEAFTGAGYDGGKIISTMTYVCKECKSLNDLSIDRDIYYANLLAKGESRPNKIEDDQKCDNCGGLEFEVWDSKNMPCPKCGTKMKIDPMGPTMYWD